MTSLADLSAAELLEVFRGGEALPTHAVTACLERIERLDPTVNAVATLSADRAMERASEADRRWREGDPRPLEGIPFGLKDLIGTAGTRTAGGTLIYRDYIPSEDATVTTLLEAAGGVLLAKLHTFEFARGGDSHNGWTRNPWGLSRSAGASSTGSGAALAARMLPLSVGTDTGGSIRVPAGVCGITGFKPTYGLVSRYGVLPQSWTLDHVGPMARTARDVAMMMAVIAGHDPRDPESIPGPVLDGSLGRTDLRGTRIGMPREHFFDIIDPSAMEATESARQTLEEVGASVVPVSLPHIGLSEAIFTTIVYAEFASLHEFHLDRMGDLGERLTRQELVNSFFISAVDYLRALRARRLLQEDFESAFEEADALLVPTMVSGPPFLEDLSLEVAGKRYDWLEVVARETLVFNLVGVPALAFPAGFDAEGLPLGVQIACRPMADELCLRIGAAFQARTDYHEARPPILEPAGASGMDPAPPAR
jgi:aspartyl-tRNA(Asn)/glutamyl-tRNA(Gln) amidotransferase subunit A